jgi:hypothetical protein
MEETLGQDLSLQFMLHVIHTWVCYKHKWWKLARYQSLHLHFGKPSLECCKISAWYELEKVKCVIPRFFFSQKELSADNRLLFLKLSL